MGIDKALIHFKRILSVFTAFNNIVAVFFSK